MNIFGLFRWKCDKSIVTFQLSSVQDFNKLIASSSIGWQVHEAYKYPRFKVFRPLFAHKRCNLNASLVFIIIVAMLSSFSIYNLVGSERVRERNVPFHLLLFNVDGTHVLMIMLHHVFSRILFPFEFTFQSILIFFPVFRLSFFLSLPFLNAPNTQQ